MRDTMKSRIRKLQNRKSALRREYDTICVTLKNTGQENRQASFLCKCIFLSIAGFGAGCFLKNPAAALLLSVLFFLIPVWKLKIYAIRYDRYLSSQLESALSLITASYVRTNNLENAMSENLPYIDPLLRAVFEEFLTEYRMNADLERCICNLSQKVSNKVFTEWCTGLIKANRNSVLREELMLIASKFSSIRIVQENLDTETGEILSQYVIMLVLLVFTVPMIYFVNYEWFTYFFSHPLGKCSVAFGVFALGYGIQSIVRCSAPVRYDL